MSPLTRSLRIVLAVTAALALAPGRVLAADAVQLVARDLGADGRHAISGEVGGGQNALSAVLRVEAVGAEAPVPIRLEAHDLVGHTPVGEQRRIPAASVTIPQGVKVSAGTPTDVRVTVSGLRDAGTFDGTLALVADGVKDVKPLSVPVRLEAQTRPAATASPATLSIKIAKCWWVGCWITRTVVGALTPGETWPLELHGSGDDVARVESLQLWLVGERSGEAAGGAITAAHPVPPAAQPAPEQAPGEPVAQAARSAPPPVPASREERPWEGCGTTSPGFADHGRMCPGGALRIPLTVNAAVLAPQKYSGEVVAALRGPPPSSLRSTFTTRAEVLVRDGPGIPILLLIVGIGLGRLARGIETPAAQAQLRLIAKWRRARDEAVLIRDDAVKMALLAELRTHEAAIERGDAEATVQDAIATTRTLVDYWRLVEWWESVIDAAKLQGLAPQIEAVRNRVVNLDLSGAKQAYAAFNTAAVAATPPAARGIAPTAAAPPPEPPAAARTLRGGAKTADQIVGALVGSASPATSKLVVAAKLAFLASLVLLAIIGVQTLYISAPTFGDDGLVDYLGLVLWGLSADIANRTLQNLPALKAS
jgi:hypothetical protein